MKRAPSPEPAPGRRGFTLTETLVALGVLGGVLLLVTQVGYEALRERRRNAARQEALEAAANALEAARACPWEELTADWAGRQRLPEALARRLGGGRLTVRVEPEVSRHHTRRVTVEVHWSHEDRPARPVQLVTLRSTRSAPAPGAKG